MNNLTDLHEVLHDLERHAPDVGTVRARLNRDLDVPGRSRLARLAVPLSAAAVVVAVASVSVVLASADHNAGRQVGTSPSGSSGTAGSTVPDPSSVGTSAPASTSPSAVQIIPGRPPAPVDLTWRFTIKPVPGYVITRESITQEVQSARVTVAGANKDIGGIAVYSPGVLDPAGLTGGAKVRVNGKTGYFGVVADKPTLSWEYLPTAWAEVSGDWGSRFDETTGKDNPDMSVALAGEQTIANAVDTSSTSPLMVDFTIGWLPTGLAAADSNFYADYDGGPLCTLDFTDGRPGVADAGTPNLAGVSALSVTRSQTGQVSGQPDSGPTGERVTIEGKTAYYDPTGLFVAYPDGTTLAIVVDGIHLGRFSKADLVRIARSVSFAPKPADRGTWVTAAHAIPH